MKVHIVADKDYRYAPTCKKRMEELGYEVIQHDIPVHLVKPSLPYGQTIEGVTYMPKSQWKPFLIRDLLNEGDVFYVDADTYMNERVDELFEHDVVLTEHIPPIPNAEGFDHVTGRLNAGVVFIKQNFKGKAFVQQWLDAMWETRTGSDQEALHLVMDLPIVTKVDSRIYNNTRWPKNNSKIYHYVGWQKKQYPI